jgi:peptide/nickel transport system substrate-binding protein
MRHPRRFVAFITAALPLAATLLLASAGTQAGQMVETPYFEAKVAAGELPPVAQRIPATPAVAEIYGEGRTLGQHGGDLRTLMGRSKDTKRMVVYGYARLVGYDSHFKLVADMLESFTVEEGRIFTLKLRKGHKWSDGHPFTSEDFRFYWEDFATDNKVSTGGPPVLMLVDGEAPKFEVIDETTVRYSWSKPNPFFLPALAAAAPLYIYRPAHYMKQFHEKYADAETLSGNIKQFKQRNWVALLYNMSRQYRNNNPELPSLQPWVLRTKPPSDRFIFERNAFYHRIDAEGRQLPYIDRWIMGIASPKLIPAKVGTGDSDLQAQALQFNNATFLKEGELHNDYKVRLWRTARGSRVALFPNLNTTDVVWRPLVRNADFRRALSLAINRSEINESLYFGLAIEGNNTVLPASPLYRDEYTTMWAEYDPDMAEELLDNLGLSERDDEDIRLLPNGEPMELIVESASEEMEQADVLQLIGENLRDVGIKMHVRVLQRETFRNRIFAGTTVMSVWSGFENGIPTADLPPRELAPTSQVQYQWPKWGQYHDTMGQAGEAIDLEPAKRLAELNDAWMIATTTEEREDIWQEMLGIHANQTFSIGIVSGVFQPVVVSNRLRNVPVEGVFNWDPGAHFGLYRPDTFWLADGDKG